MTLLHVIGLLTCILVALVVRDFLDARRLARFEGPVRDLRRNGGL